MVEERNWVNARITATELGFARGDEIMNFWLYLDYGGAGQGAGGYALSGWDEKLQRGVGWGGGLDLIMQILRVIGVERWENLPGTHCRVVANVDRVEAIGHLLEDRWLWFGAEIEALRARYGTMV